MRNFDAFTGQPTMPPPADLPAPPRDDRHTYAEGTAVTWTIPNELNDYGSDPIRCVIVGPTKGSGCSRCHCEPQDPEHVEHGWEGNAPCCPGPWYSVKIDPADNVQDDGVPVPVWGEMDKPMVIELAEHELEAA